MSVFDEIKKLQKMLDADGIKYTKINEHCGQYAPVETSINLGFKDRIVVADFNDGYLNAVRITNYNVVGDGRADVEWVFKWIKGAMGK